MNTKKLHKGHLVDQENLPDQFPTHRHSPQFWEQLGRTIATCGLLEETLGKAIFAFTATRQYDESEIDAAYEAWPPILERALTDSLGKLADAYEKAARDNQKTITTNIDERVEDIKKLSKIRNVLCHGSWYPPDAEGKSVPRFVSKNMKKFETALDVEDLKKVQEHTVELICLVMETVTVTGLKFPGTNGLGEPIWPKY